jgi:hypothetical protein
LACGDKTAEQAASLLLCDLKEKGTTPMHTKSVLAITAAALACLSLARAAAAPQTHHSGPIDDSTAITW